MTRFHKDFHLSKSLSWLLRHGACEEGFELSPEGYLEVCKILQHPLFQSRYQLSDVVRVVRQDAKQRFNLRQSPSTGNLEIKANQGHSIPTVSDDGLTPILTPKYSTVVHGTYYKWWSSIERDGLNRMSRNHIHFAKGTLDDPKVISGLRESAEILIYINLPKALADGYKFFESENGVILTSGNHRGFLKPEYFLRAVCLKTGRILYP
ncbi:unnamed protein product [Arctia plantaginis]|uniref:2'-phosphotransferase n=1 Tax=Arctia plantaginis TaxID=874455 RepID=A0A8S1A7Y5_ARCPL|nr:unnamed protein product [Arctia plantaginis]CAB3240671.1 unnamed protein product [Arctia plantaginis]